MGPRKLSLFPSLSSAIRRCGPLGPRVTKDRSSDRPRSGGIASLDVGSSVAADQVIVRLEPEGNEDAEEVA